MSLRLLCVATVGCVLLGACTGGDRQINQTFEALDLDAGGTLAIAGAGDIDSLDPAFMLSSTSWFLARGLFRTLVAYSSANGSGGEGSLVPDLAIDTGEANANRTQWTFELKEGVTFGSGRGGADIEGVTDEAITSGDVKYAIERLFRLDPLPGATAYFDDIVGAEQFALGTADDLSGIKTPDENTIVFELDKPIGDWPFRLAVPAAGPVPANYARGLDLPGGDDYSDHVVSTGPYFVESWIPGETLRLKRNDSWEPDSDTVRAAFVDEVDWEFGFAQADAVAASTTPKIVSGKYDLVEGAAPGDVLVGSSFQQSVVEAPSLCTRYLWINPKIAPFDNAQVRAAVSYAVDRARLVELQGGDVTGQVATSLLPPGIAGHLDPETYNPFESPSMTGHIKKAKSLLAKAGFEGGYDGHVLIAGNNESPEDEYAQSVKDDLEKIGFTDVEVKLVAQPGLTTDFYAQAGIKGVAIGTSLGRCREYLDPSSFFEPLLSSDDDSDADAAGAYGLGGLSAKKLKKLLAKAEAEAPGPARTSAWEAVNRFVTEAATVVPWSWDNRQLLYNRGQLLNPVYNRSYSGIDWVVAGLSDR